MGVALLGKGIYDINVLNSYCWSKNLLDWKITLEKGEMHVETGPCCGVSQIEIMS
jgi:hypothetical protein